MEEKNLCAKAGIAPASVTKMCHNGHFTPEIPLKICNAPDCGVEDIMEIVPEANGSDGELLFLEECHEAFGPMALSQWAGSSDEAHDFYFSSNAAEVKTTASQAPYYAHISSEYQLDNNDIQGILEAPENDYVICSDVLCVSDYGAPQNVCDLC